MPAHSAIGIADDLAAGDACVAFRTANHEPASRINQVGCFLVDPSGRHYFFDQEFNQGFADFLLFHIGRVLRRNNDSGGAEWLVAIVFNRDLRLGIGTQPWNFARFAQARQLAPEFVRE